MQRLILVLYLVFACECISQVEQPQTADQIYQKAMSTYKLGSESTNIDERISQITTAGRYFEYFMLNYRGHERARDAEYYRALCYYHTGDFDNAKQIFSNIITSQKTGPYVAAAASVMAQDAFDKKDYVAAGILYAKLSANAVKVEDRHRGIYYEAICHHYRRLEKQALQCYESIMADEAAANGPYMHLCRKAAGVLRLNLGDAAKALEIFQVLRNSLAPEEYRAEAALYSGICSLRLHDEEAAEKYFQEVLQNANVSWLIFHPDALTYIMQLRFNQKNYADVVDLYRTNPLNTNDARQARRSQIVGKAMMKLKRYMDALSLFLEVQKLDADGDLGFEASFNRLLCFYQLDGRNIPQQVDAFVEIYGKSHKNHASIHSALMMKAAALQDIGLSAEAAEVFRLIDESRISENMRDDLLYNRAWCLAKANDHLGAIRSASKFLELFPTDVRKNEALALRGDCRYKSADRAGAISDFTELLSLNPSPKLATMAWQKKAFAHKDQKDYAPMIDCYEKLLGLLADTSFVARANAHFWIGYGYQKRQTQEKACTHLQEARKLDAKTYKKNAGLLLINSYFELQNIDALCEEIDLALENGYSDAVSPAIISWAGVQSLGLNKAQQASRFFLLIANPNEPRSTPRDVWRNLTRAQMMAKDYRGALKSVEHFLATENKPQPLAAALFDKALCHLKLGKLDLTKIDLDSAFSHQPQGILKAEGEILMGDYFMEAKKPSEAKKYYETNASRLDDQRLKPLALHKLARALEANQEAAQAKVIQEQLKTQFPQWKFEE